MGDIFRIDVTGADVEACLGLAMHATNGGKVVGWSVNHTLRRLVLYSYASDKMIPFPAPFQNAYEVAVIVKRWLGNVEYPREPDTDGHNERGWRIFNEQYSRVGDEWEAFVAIEPVWLTYGK